MKTKGLRKRNGYWHYRIVRNGREWSGNTGLVATARNKSAAITRRKEVERSLPEEELTPSEPIGFPEAAGQFVAWCQTEYRSKPNTWKRISGSMSSMVDFWEAQTVESLKPRDVEAYKMHRRLDHCVKDVTLHNDLCNLSLFNKYAKKQGWTDINLLEDVEIPSGADAVRIHVLTSEEESQYFELAAVRSPDLHDLGRLILEQGCRPDEIRSLPQTAVNLRDKTLTVRGGKTSAARRTLDLTPTSVAILEKRITGQKWVFPSSRKRGHHIGTLQSIHDSVCRDAGVSFVLYDLRHTMATRFAEVNRDPYQLAAVLGHAGLRCVMKYVHVQQEHIKRGMARYVASMKRKLRRESNAAAA